jgi:hypothetical protein
VLFGLTTSRNTLASFGSFASKKTYPRHLKYSCDYQGQAPYFWSSPKHYAKGDFFKTSRITQYSGKN